jgi:hypothetical protein
MGMTDGQLGKSRRFERGGRWYEFFSDKWQIVWGALLGMMGAVSVWHPVKETDPLWHLSQGREVLRQGARVLAPPSMLDGFSDELVVPEWLWDVTVYGLHLLGGWTAQALFVALLGAGCGVALVRLAARFTPAGGERSILLVSGLAMVLALARLRLRPQSAFIVILPIFIALSFAVVEARERRARIKAIGGLVLLQLLWAQCHGSFVIGPAIFLIALLAGWPARSDRDRRTAWLVTLLALSLTLLSSAWGAHIAEYVLFHASGDAPRHIRDMQSPSWEVFNPRHVVFGPVYLLMWGLVLAGAPWLERFPLPELGLALLGVVLGLTAGRFFVAGGILLVPLLAKAFGGFHGKRLRTRWMAVVYVLVVLGFGVAALSRTSDKRGPLGQVGLQVDRHPLGAVRFFKARLRDEGARERVLTSFGAGPLLAFELDGRVATFVDSRTPVFFDYVDYAVARDVFSNSAALETALSRYDADSIVVDRGSPICTRVPPGWVPAVIEPGFTTFVKEDSAPAIRSIAPCGAEYMSPAVCGISPSAFREELRRLEAYVDREFGAFVRLSRRILCKEAMADAASKTGYRDGSRRLFSAEWRRVTGMARLLDHRYDDALRLLAPLAERGDTPSLMFLLGMVSEPTADRARLREALEAIASELDDAAPPDLRVGLAALCLASGDGDCVRFNGLRAAAQGDRRALPMLEWLSAHHPSRRVRDDARAWLGALSSTPWSAE